MSDLRAILVSIIDTWQQTDGYTISSEMNAALEGAKATLEEERTAVFPLGWCTPPQDHYDYGVDPMTQADLEQYERDHVFDMPEKETNA